jgi:hypothetical protein
MRLFTGLSVGLAALALILLVRWLEPAQFADVVREGR